MVLHFDHADPQESFQNQVVRPVGKKVLTDKLLCQVAREIEQGLFEADLGGGICKKRVAVEGQGKSGSTRTLVANRHAGTIIFLVGREKTEPGTDFSDVVVLLPRASQTACRSSPFSS